MHLLKILAVLALVVLLIPIQGTEVPDSTMDSEIVQEGDGKLIQSMSIYADLDTLSRYHDYTGNRTVIPVTTDFSTDLFTWKFDSDWQLANQAYYNMTRGLLFYLEDVLGLTNQFFGSAPFQFVLDELLIDVEQTDFDTLIADNTVNGSLDFQNALPNFRDLVTADSTPGDVILGITNQTHSGALRSLSYTGQADLTSNVGLFYTSGNTREDAVFMAHSLGHLYYAYDDSGVIPNTNPFPEIQYNQCPADQNIMSPSINLSRIDEMTDFSSCSIQAFEKIVEVYPDRFSDDPVDTTAPEFRINHMSETGFSLDETFQLGFNASDDHGLHRVEFLVDGQVVHGEYLGIHEYGKKYNVTIGYFEAFLARHIQFQPSYDGEMNVTIIVYDTVSNWRQQSVIVRVFDTNPETSTETVTETVSLPITETSIITYEMTSEVTQVSETTVTTRDTTTVAAQVVTTTEEGSVQTVTESTPLMWTSLLPGIILIVIRRRA